MPTADGTLKRLFYDLETSPNIGFFWQPGYQVNIGYESIIKERAIICVSYKWNYEKKVHNITWDKNQNDKNLLKEFIPIMNEADEIVAHNGDNFDLKWLRGRAIFHGLPMPPEYTSIDTLKLARSGFKFNSNRLDYIAQYLGVEGKISTSYDLWKDIVLKKDEKALKKMVKYCDNDVVILEKIWDKMNPYVKAKSRVVPFRGNCPECGCSERNVANRKTRAGGTQCIQLRCKQCGKHETLTENQLMKINEQS